MTCRKSGLSILLLRRLPLDPPTHFQTVAEERDSFSSDRDQEDGSSGMPAALWVKGVAYVGGSCWDATVRCGSLGRDAECTRRPRCSLCRSSRWDTIGRCVGDTNSRLQAALEHRWTRSRGCRINDRLGRGVEWRKTARSGRTLGASSRWDPTLARMQVEMIAGMRYLMITGT